MTAAPMTRARDDLPGSEMYEEAVTAAERLLQAASTSVQATTAPRFIVYSR